MRGKENRELETGCLVEVRAQFVEIYCEKMYDLLQPSQRALDKGKSLPANLGTHGLPNAANIVVPSIEAFQRLMEEASQRRTSAISKGRCSTSRSHAALVIHLWQKTPLESLQSTATFVDLAGSEDMGKSGLSSQQVNETRAINLSLFHLRSMVEDLAKGARKTAAVQSKSSKLTDLLAATLSGHCMVTLMLNLSPCAFSDRESQRTLKFGMSGMKVKVKAQPNRTMDEAVARVKKELSEMEEKEREIKAAPKGDALRNVSQERQALQYQLGEVTAKARQRLELERELQTAWLDNVRDLWSITETLRFGVSPAIRDRYMVVQHLISSDIDEHERTLDRGVRNCDTVVISAHRKVTKWLQQWAAIGAWSAELWRQDNEADDQPPSALLRSSALETSPSTVAPVSEWDFFLLETMKEATADLQHDLWELENRKDTMNTSYVRLSASLGCLSKEIFRVSTEVAAETQLKDGEGTLKKKDIELSAAAGLAQRVVSRAKEQLASKQAAMEEKKQEVMEQLDSCLQIDLRGVFARMQRSGTAYAGDAWSGASLEVYGPRFNACQSWGDMLPLAQDILAVAIEGLKEASARKQAASDTEAQASSPTEDVRQAGQSTGRPGNRRPGKGSGQGGTSSDRVDLGEGLLAWVADVKGNAKLHIGAATWDPEGAAVEGAGMLLGASQVRHLCGAAEAVNEAVEKAADGACAQEFRSDGLLPLPLLDRWM
mmetsp:Transcript_4775/g.13296  ORF Transcript_4775/g.13296 Transcript_4775/m.13296 type:complete len:717 (+) Transcript_4775:321-2471(+)